MCVETIITPIEENICNSGLNSGVLGALEASGTDDVIELGNERSARKPLSLESTEDYTLIVLSLAKAILAGDSESFNPFWKTLD